MPRILLDGSELDLAAGTPTWGAVLHDVDRRLAEAGRIVTDVRFDGLDEPAFREPGTLARPLRELAILEVLSGTPRGLMERCLEEAVAAISPLCAAALAVGEGFRSQKIAPANQALAELAEGLSSLIGVVGAAELAFQVDLQHLRGGGHSAAAVVGELGSHLEALAGNVINAEITYGRHLHDKIVTVLGYALVKYFF